MNNKNQIARIVAVLLVMTLAITVMTACIGNQEPTEPEHLYVPTEPTTLPGIVDNDFQDSDFEDSSQITEPPATDPTTEPEENESSSTQPEATEQPAAKPETTQPEHTEPPAVDSQPTEPEQQITEYEWYEALSPDEQVAYYETFESMEAFVKWYNSAKAEYDRLHPPIEGGDGEIDLGDISNGSNG